MGNMGPMRRTMEYINTFCLNEYQTPADFTNLGEVPLLYSTLGDYDEHDVQINVDLLEKEVHYFVDEEEVATDRYDTYEAMADDMFWANFGIYYAVAKRAYEIRYPHWEEYDQIERTVAAAEAAEAYRDWMREQGIFEMLNLDTVDVDPYYNQGVF